jgi:hypothetical protein
MLGPWPYKYADYVDQKLKDVTAGTKAARFLRSNSAAQDIISRFMPDFDI